MSSVLRLSQGDVLGCFTSASVMPLFFAQPPAHMLTFTHAHMLSCSLHTCAHAHLFFFPAFMHLHSHTFTFSHIHAHTPIALTSTYMHPRTLVRRKLLVALSLHLYFPFLLLSFLSPSFSPVVLFYFLCFCLVCPLLSFHLSPPALPPPSGGLLSCYFSVHGIFH